MSGAMKIGSGDALLVIDVQNDFCPGGALPNRPPFQTITLPYGAQTLWPDHCVATTPGAAFHPDLDIPQAGLIPRKGGIRRSIPIQLSKKTTAKRKPVSPAICASAG